MLNREKDGHDAAFSVLVERENFRVWMVVLVGLYLDDSVEARRRVRPSLNINDVEVILLLKTVFHIYIQSGQLRCKTQIGRAHV